MSWQRYKRYNFLICDTKDKLELADTYIKTNTGLLAFDTETNGLHIKKNVIIGFSFSVDSTSGIYVPLLSWVPDKSITKIKKILEAKTEIHPEGYFRDVWDNTKIYPENVSQKDYIIPQFIKNLLEKWAKSAGLLMHNAPFDCNMVKSNFKLDITDNLFCDTMLLKHFLDENTPLSLKDTATLWSDKLGFSAYADAKSEQQELGFSVQKNGGKFAGEKHIWRGDLLPVGKYAVADTGLTFGIFEAGIDIFYKNYSEKHEKLFFDTEIMPLCKEVVIPMIFKGVYIDVPYFLRLEKETKKLLDSLEDEIITQLAPLINDFSIGASMEEAVSTGKLIKRIIEREGLEIPLKHTKKDNSYKPSLAKDVVKKAYQQEPHWVWAYILGEGAIKYSEQELEALRKDIYLEELGRRHRFNINSRGHIRWLFFTKLGYDKTKFPQTKSATAKNPIPSVAAENLKQHFLKDHDFVKPLLRFYKLFKLYSSYIQPACELNVDGWLNMNIKQAGTKSGRFSIAGGFNLQTLPKVEELEKCVSCGGDDTHLENTYELLVDVHCRDCGHLEKDNVSPSAIKSGFIAPPGYKIVNADFKSLEPKVFASVSGEEALKDIYRKGLDMYSQVYAKMENRPYEDLKKVGKNKERNMIKPVALGITYGAMGPQVANLMGLKKKVLDRESGEMKEILDVELGIQKREQFLDAFPALKTYMVDCELEAISKGYVETMLGRRRHFQWAPFIVNELLSPKGIDYTDFITTSTKNLAKPDIFEYNLFETDLVKFAKFRGLTPEQMKEAGNWSWAYVKGLLKNELNNAKNHKIQGMAAHITNRSMIDITRALNSSEIDGYVNMNVHDEITLYVANTQVDCGAEILQRCMENNEATKFIDVKMEAEPIIANSLKEAK